MYDDSITGIARKHFQALFTVNYLLAAARYLEEQGKHDEANKLYERALKEMATLLQKGLADTANSVAEIQKLPTDQQSPNGNG